MKNIRIYQIGIVFLFLIAIFSLAGADKTPENNKISHVSPLAGEQIKKGVVSGGGTSGDGVTYGIRGTVGQSVVGHGESENFGSSQGYWPDFYSSIDNACCEGQTGDVNCIGGDEPDISDIVRLIDYLYLSKDPLCCPEEAETNGDCGPEPDISDIVRIIDYLYLPTHTPPVDCSHCSK